MTPPLRCRCGCPRWRHRGNWGNPTACAGYCGCSYFEPYDPADDTLPNPVDVLPDPEAWAAALHLPAFYPLGVPTP